ncbi:hypothetical protein E2C01_058124 [Portunus trituberculatus]|uniref:Uncharacterized protein n=1 Tax=Portunus trituberculatus TaxID=210409 RepID=A0A5B7H577_PORTR|nr:hypothetical protein [Portunus trituberculatus]
MKGGVLEESQSFPLSATLLQPPIQGSPQPPAWSPAALPDFWSLRSLKQSFTFSLKTLSTKITDISNVNETNNASSRAAPPDVTCSTPAVEGWLFFLSKRRCHEKVVLYSYKENSLGFLRQAAFPSQEAELSKCRRCTHPDDEFTKPQQRGVAASQRLLHTPSSRTYSMPRYLATHARQFRVVVAAMAARGRVSMMGIHRWSHDVNNVKCKPTPAKYSLFS